MTEKVYHDYQITLLERYYGQKPVAIIGGEVLMNKDGAVVYPVITFDGTYRGFQQAFGKWIREQYDE
jgi:hypothetical protein